MATTTKTTVKMDKPYKIFFPQDPKHWNEVVIKFKLTDSATVAAFNFYTAAGETKKLEISYKDDENTLTLNEKRVTNPGKIDTLVFRLFKKHNNNKIKVFPSHTHSMQRYDMDVKEFEIEEIHYVELTGGFKEVNAVMFRFNPPPPDDNDSKNDSNDEDKDCKCVCLCECAWCACCVKDKPK